MTRPPAEQEEAPAPQRLHQDGAKGRAVRPLRPAQRDAAVEEGHEDAQFHQRDKAGDVPLHRRAGAFGIAARDDKGDR